MKRILMICAVCMFGMFNTINAQFDPLRNCITDANDICVSNTQLTAVPFLSIVPDARAGAMGDAGIAVSTDASAMHFNASKLAFTKEDVGLGVTYTPWLRNLGLNDVYIAYLSGFRKIDELSTVGFGMRYFSLGEINFTDINGDPTGTGSPKEIEFSAAYARKLGTNFSAGLTGKYIYSNLASGQTVQGVEIVSANAFAADISLSYTKESSITEAGSQWNFGLALKNIGSKVSYTGNTVKDFLPTNLGLGVALDMNLDDYNAITVAFDINKLMTPSPISRQLKLEDGTLVDNPDYDSDNNGFADYREKALFSGIFGSFNDAQGGFSEELKEFNFSLGVEYWYNKQFAVRAGYYYENPLKGDRQFLTVGFGMKYNIFGLNLSYLTPTNNRRNPLDNTLRFSILFDFDGGGVAPSTGN